MSELNNAKVSGAGTIEGGEYNSVQISGAGKILGNVKASSVQISGSGTCAGNLSANSLKVSGSFKCEGTVDVKDSLSVSGSSSFFKTVNCTNISTRGSVGFNDKLNFDTTDMMGSIKITNGCKGKYFSAAGKVNIDSTLCADFIKISLYDPYNTSYVKEIKGKEITISLEKAERKANVISIFSSLTGKKQDALKSEKIEGNTIHIVNTECALIKGNNIVIGKKCNIKRVEYTGILSVDESSTVEEQVHIKI